MMKILNSNYMVFICNCKFLVIRNSNSIESALKKRYSRIDIIRLKAGLMILVLR